MQPAGRQTREQSGDLYRRRLQRKPRPRRVGGFGWINLVFPVPVLFFLGVFVLAILNLERGTIRWKNRQFRTR